VAGGGGGIRECGGGPRAPSPRKAKKTAQRDVTEKDHQSTLLGNSVGRVP